MRSTFINNEEQLKTFILKKYSYKILEYISKKIVKVMKSELSKAKISTYSLRKGVGYTINKEGNESVIEIDYAYVQETYSSPPVFDFGLKEWGNFTNTFGVGIGIGIWKGEPLSLKVSEWIEKGGPKGLGNQPIPQTKWFTNTKRIVKNSLNKWLNEYIKKYLR